MSRFITSNFDAVEQNPAAFSQPGPDDRPEGGEPPTWQPDERLCVARPPLCRGLCEGLCADVSIPSLRQLTFCT